MAVHWRAPSPQQCQRYNAPMEKVFRDPVHNLMRFDMDRDRLALQLLDTAEVQRMRHIRQMGVSDFIFPGATHSRFSHLLGVAHLMSRILERMELLRKEAPLAHIALSLDEHRELLLAAALLHDIGHFPYSHLLEDVIGEDHEAWSVRLILDAGSDVHQALSQRDPGYPEQVARILQRSYKPSYAVKLISSQLDVDRMDYLLRDSLYTGVGYGKFDLDWLLHSLRIVEVDGDYEVAIDASKGLQVAESYVLARHYMYQQVYHHKTERAAGALLLRLFQRAALLLRQGRLLDTPEPVQTLLLAAQALDRDSFLQLNDVLLGYSIWLWTQSRDAIVADLSKRFLQRRVFKTLPITLARYGELKASLEAAVRDQGFDPDYYLVLDDAVDSPYTDPYWGDGSREASEHIYVVDGQGGLSDLSEKSPLIQALRDRSIGIQRLCFPQELRAVVEARIAA